jgi:tetratricopeptide (TPR) repeat protein
VLAAPARRAYELLALGRWQQVVAACDELLALAADVSGEGARQHEAWALRTKADALIELKQYEAALAELDLLLGRFGSSVDKSVQASVAGGLEQRVIAYRKLGATDRELAASEELTQRFANSTAPDVARAVSLALYWQGILLEKWSSPGFEDGRVGRSGVTAPGWRG